MALVRRAPERVTRLCLMSTTSRPPTSRQYAMWARQRAALAAGATARDLQRELKAALAAPPGVSRGLCAVRDLVRRRAGDVRAARGRAVQPDGAGRLAGGRRASGGRSGRRRGGAGDLDHHVAEGCVGGVARGARGPCPRRAAAGAGGVRRVAGTRRRYPDRCRARCHAGRTPSRRRGAGLLYRRARDQARPARRVVAAVARSDRDAGRRGRGDRHATVRLCRDPHRRRGVLVRRRGAHRQRILRRARGSAGGAAEKRRTRRRPRRSRIST